MESKKMIIIGANTQMEMSFEEVLKKYTPLLQKKANQWAKTYEYDELFQIASIALWNAYKNYNAEEYSIAFGLLAAKYVENGLINYHTKNKPKYDLKTSKIRGVVSLNDIVFDTKDRGVELQELIGAEETYTEETADRIVLDKLFNKLTKRQQQDILDYMSGYNCEEIAAFREVSGQAVRNRMKTIFSKMRMLYSKEMAL